MDKFKSFNEYINSFPGTHILKEMVSGSTNETLITYPIDFFIKKMTEYLSFHKFHYNSRKDVYKNVAYFWIKTEDVTMKSIEHFKQIAFRNGYFLSYVNFVNDENLFSSQDVIPIKDIDDEILQTHSNANLIGLCFESRFDKSYVIVPPFLYHATSNAWYKKIMKAGLVPKSRSKMTNHPERIYFAFNIEDVKDLINQFVREIDIEKGDSQYIIDYKKAKQDMVILKIDTSNLNAQFYEDPNCKDAFGVFGVYTYDSINPKYIEKIDF